MIKVLLICLGKENSEGYMNIAVVSVTNQGDEISERLSEVFNITPFSKNHISDFNLGDITKKLMEDYEAIIFISSTGIAVRAIAPYLKSKATDPAVLVIDSTGSFVISLVSGHLGGANELTLKVAKCIKALPVITTATDNLGLIAPDIIARDNHLVIDDLKNAKIIAAKLVAGGKIAFIDEASEIAIPKGYEASTEVAEGLVYVTNKKNLKVTEGFKESLKLIRRNIVLGIGCKKNFSVVKMRECVLSILNHYNVDIRSIKIVTTVVVKRNEVAILELNKYFESELNIWRLEEIKKVQHNYTGSDFVEKTIGVRAVCEPCVELSKGTLLTEKIACKGMTICIGEIQNK
ncbi:cobalt-precorrin 5A hydrolase [Clostridium sp.]|uniref:cobalt-precorrin 5A hydrolase n=1 Tax=Clostridium sp. TaxID=1506 RepID=UPI003D6CFDD8